VQIIKKTLALFALVPVLAWAQPQMKNYQTICVSSQDLTKTIDEFKELPYVRGLSSPMSQEGENLSLVVFINPETRTFTIVEKAGDNVYCILAVGGGFEPVPRNIQDDVRSGQEKGQL
jgi:hypothetical protein